MVNEKYSPTVCYSIDKQTREVNDYPPRVKISIDNSIKSLYVKYPGKSKVVRVEVTPDTIGTVICKGDYVKPVVENKSVWMSQLGFGTKWKLITARVYKSDICNEDIAGGSDDDDDGEEEEEDEAADDDVSMNNIHTSENVDPNIRIVQKHADEATY